MGKIPRQQIIHTHNQPHTEHQQHIDRLETPYILQTAQVIGKSAIQYMALMARSVVKLEQLYIVIKHTSFVIVFVIFVILDFCVSIKSISTITIPRFPPPVVQFWCTEYKKTPHLATIHKNSVFRQPRRNLLLFVVNCCRILLKKQGVIDC